MPIVDRPSSRDASPDGGAVLRDEGGKPPLQGSLEALRAFANEHPFWRSRLLAECRAGHLTLEDFRYVFSQYYLYSKNFTRALAALMARCDDDRLRSRLSENLWEEGGGAAPEKRHAEIFRRFLMGSLGLDLQKIQFSEASRYFQSEFLGFCLRAEPAAGAAFLSLGTEAVVARMYQTFIDGLLKAGVPEEGLEFFRIHVGCDDEHAEVLEQIMLSYADQPDWFQTCRRAIDSALTLRLGFFENLYEALQARRIAPLLERINARRSLAPAELDAASALATLKASAETRQALYSNKHEKLNIDFQVDSLPFASEVLDPRVVRIPAGKFNELHKHAHETVFVILSGTGQVLVDDFAVPVKPGDFVFVPRWCMHQTQNLGDTEMTVLAITDYHLTQKAYVGDYLKTARMKRASAAEPTNV